MRLVLIAVLAFACHPAPPPAPLRTVLLESEPFVEEEPHPMDCLDLIKRKAEGVAVFTNLRKDAKRRFAEAFASLHADLERGVPSLVCIDHRLRLVVGYDAARDQVIYHAPDEPGGAFRRIDRAAFARDWPMHYEEGLAIMVRIPMQPPR